MPNSFPHNGGSYCRDGRRHRLRNHGRNAQPDSYRHSNLSHNGNATRGSGLSGMELGVDRPLDGGFSNGMACFHHCSLNEPVRAQEGQRPLPYAYALKAKRIAVGKTSIPA